MIDDDKDISEARYIKLDGAEQIVQAGGALRPGNIRYEEYKHAGHLKCLCCESSVKIREARASRGGSSGAGHTSYFIASRHKKDCIRALSSDTSSSMVDRTKGYRLHLNTMMFSELFNRESGAYDVSPKGRITISDADLRDREAFAVNDLKELVSFMRWAKPERLKDTVVIFRNQKLDWDQFLVDTADPNAVAALADSAKRRPKGEAPPFALLQIETKQYFVQSRYGKAVPVPLEPLDAGVTKANRKREVNLQIYLDARRSGAVSWGFSTPDRYLVLGVVRHGVRSETHNLVREWLNVTIQDHRQIQNMKFIENAPVSASRAEAAKPAPSGP